MARMGKASGLIMFKASFASTIRGMKVIGLAADKGSVPQRFKLGRIHRILRHGEAALRQDALDSDHSTLGLPLHRRPAIVGYDAMARHADHLLAGRISRRLVATSPQSAQLGFDFASSDSWRVFLLWFGYRRFRPQGLACILQVRGSICPSKRSLNGEAKNLAASDTNAGVLRFAQNDKRCGGLRS
jgi:hypothetical protein